MNRTGCVLLLCVCCAFGACADKKSYKKVTFMLEDGLQKDVIKEGTGATPVRGQRVRVHYTGWLSENGTKGRKFDSSVDRGQPFEFIIGIGRVIRGWDEGVATMKVGEKSILTLKPEFGYGVRGAGAAIPPNATLIFEVELLGVA